MTDDKRDRTRTLVESERSADGARMRERLRRRLFEAEAEAAADQPVGQLIDSLLDEMAPGFRSDERIARGGMGTVERVHDTRLRRDAAMKIVRAKFNTEDWALRAFLTEAQLMAQLDHPNIVPVHGIGRLEDGRLFFTMKYVRGQTFTDLIGDLPDELTRSSLFRVLDVIVKVCDALALAHDRGVIHCDIKPSNIMVGDFGEVYLMDWGISRVLTEHEGGRISTSVRPRTPDGPFGTACYMPPEQAEGRPELTDERSDVFGVGTLLYTAVTRHPPYRAKTAVATMLMAEVADFSPPSDYWPDIPSELERIILRAMSRDRQDRHQSIAELRKAIRDFMHGERSFPVEQYEAGETIIAEGDEGDAGYIIESGACDVTRLRNGETTHLRRMGPGEVFGETAVLTSAPRTATVVAVEDTTVHVVTREAFDEAMASMSPWMSAFVQSLAQRFRERESTR